MQRLADHFKLGPPLAGAGNDGSAETAMSGRAVAGERMGERAGVATRTDSRHLPAERGEGRPPLRHGRYRGLPIWFHAHEGELGAPAASATLATDDGQERFDPDDAIACLQYEHYVGWDRSGGATDAKRLKTLYYLLKPFMPRALQLELQRLNARRRLRQVRFPAWPQDSTLTDLLAALLAASMGDAGIEQVPFLGFWPHGKTWAWCLTHDVDTGLGYAAIESLAQVEEERGLQSCWYVVPERYRVEVQKLESLQQRGHEIGVHGLEHSGRLFSSRQEFERRRDRINAYVRDWGVVGFRSPATYRNPYWLPEIDVDHDSSYMDNATLEPQRGGICAAFPFMLSERLVEIPITLPMDHTLINVLRQDVLQACRAKTAWVRAQHGLGVALFHPDYNTQRRDRERYGVLLEHLAADRQAWCALPAQVADWWQRRRQSRLVLQDGVPRIEGPAAADGCIWWARLADGTVQFEPPHP